MGSSRTVSDLFWAPRFFAPPAQFLSLFGFLPDSFGAFSGFGASGSLFKPLGSSQTVSQPFWAPPGQFLLLPDSFGAFLGSSRTVSGSRACMLVSSERKRRLCFAGGSQVVSRKTRTLLRGTHNLLFWRENFPPVSPIFVS